MFDIWKSVISGNLTEDPALKKSKEGREYVTFSVAVNIEQNLTNYFSVYCFEKRHMDFANAFLDCRIRTAEEIAIRREELSQNRPDRHLPQRIHETAFIRHKGGSRQQ